jgi:FtsH-binding integral membrane protein
MFGSLALYGAVTKRDLTGLGPILFGALIALIVATFVNIFVGGSTLYWITTLMLYLDFINIFLFLLRIFGRAR